MMCHYLSRVRERDDDDDVMRASWNISDASHHVKTISLISLSRDRVICSYALLKHTCVDILINITPA
jgi:hypothetical protein